MELWSDTIYEVCGQRLFGKSFLALNAFPCSLQSMVIAIVLSLCCGMSPSNFSFTSLSFQWESSSLRPLKVFKGGPFGFLNQREASPGPTNRCIS